MPKVFIVFIYS